MSLKYEPSSEPLTLNPNRPIGHKKFEEQFMHTEGAAAAPQVAHSAWTQVLSPTPHRHRFPP